MTAAFTPIAPAKARLLPGLFLERFKLNRSNMLSLQAALLLQNHDMEAGLWQPLYEIQDEAFTVYFTRRPYDG